MTSFTSHPNPSASTSTLKSQTSASSDLKRAVIDARIEIVKRELAYLLRERNALSPVYRLPPGILLLIFQNVQLRRVSNPTRAAAAPVHNISEHGHEREHDCARGVDDVHKWASVFLHTCSAWREVAAANPSLWNRIVVPSVAVDSIGTSVRTKWNPRWIGGLLGLSITLPLSITLSIAETRGNEPTASDEGEILRQVLDHSHRISSLEITAPATWYNDSNIISQFTLNPMLSLRFLSFKQLKSTWFGDDPQAEEKTTAQLPSSFFEALSSHSHHLQFLELEQITICPPTTTTTTTAHFPHPKSAARTVAPSPSSSPSSSSRSTLNPTPRRYSFPSLQTLALVSPFHHALALLNHLSFPPTTHLQLTCTAFWDLYRHMPNPYSQRSRDPLLGLIPRLWKERKQGRLAPVMGLGISCRHEMTVGTGEVEERSSASTSHCDRVLDTLQSTHGIQIQFLAPSHNASTTTIEAPNAAIAPTLTLVLPDVRAGTVSGESAISRILSELDLSEISQLIVDIHLMEDGHPRFWYALAEKCAMVADLYVGWGWGAFWRWMRHSNGGGSGSAQASSSLQAPPTRFSLLRLSNVPPAPDSSARLAITTPPPFPHLDILRLELEHHRLSRKSRAALHDYLRGRRDQRCGLSYLELILDAEPLAGEELQALAGLVGCQLVVQQKGKGT